MQFIVIDFRLRGIQPEVDNKCANNGVRSEAAHIQLSSSHAATVLAVVPGDQSAEMCSSASAALIMHSGTPLPGRVDAPTKYRPRTAPSLMDGRNTASWFRPCDSPNAAPCSTPYRCRHCMHHSTRDWQLLTKA